MVTEVGWATSFALTGKYATLAPAGTVTEEGTLAVAVSLLLRATTAPPEGAGPLSWTIPVQLAPPGMLG